MTAKKTPSTPASKSTELTDAIKSKESTLNPDFIMESDNSINPTPAVNSTTPAKVDNLFGNEQTATDATAVTATTELPKQQRIGKQQRKSGFAEFKATYLVPSKLSKRHPVNIDDSVWEKLERIARILGDRDTTIILPDFQTDTIMAV